LLSNYSLPLS